ncbi:MAG: hypothetical protein HDS84_03835 [Bacteroidales bacterium]|nr:hypothetical protein [Bacteroidales bacterium]
MPRLNIAPNNELDTLPISTRRGTPNTCQRIYQTWHAMSLHLPMFP